MHGQEWLCRCRDGFEQSPIDLPPTSCSELITENASFEYQYVDPESLEVIYDLNLLRIRPKSGAKMGKLADVDGTTYEVTEVLFHTPSEHTI